MNLLKMIRPAPVKSKLSPPAAGKPDVLALRMMLYGCSLTNPVREPVTDESGHKLGDRVVPLRYEFHSGPCVFGKDQPDRGCRFCALHTEIPLVERSMREPEADALQEAAPEAWGTLVPQRLDERRTSPVAGS